MASDWEEVPIEPSTWVPALGKKDKATVDSELEKVKKGMAKPEELAAAMVGGAPMPAGVITKLAGKALSPLAELIIGKVGGLTPEATKTLMSNPKAIRVLAKATDLEKQGMAEKVLQEAGAGLKEKMGSAGDLVREKLASVRIPESKVTGALSAAKDAGSPILSDPGIGLVQGMNLKDAQRAIGAKQTNWKLDPATGTLSKATDPEMGRAYGVIKEALTEASPEAQQAVEQMSKLYEGQDILKAASNKPINFFKTSSPDIRASGQTLDQLLGKPVIDPAAKQFRAAYEYSRPMQGVDALRREFIAKPAVSVVSGVQKASAIPQGIESLLQRQSGKLKIPASSADDDEWEEIK